MNQSADASVPHIRLPGCKSLSQRALVLAASGHGKCLLSGLSSCDDSRFLRQALVGLGVEVGAVCRPVGNELPDSASDSASSEPFESTTDWMIHGLGGPPQGQGQIVDVGEAGSSLRFLLPWCAAGQGEFVLTGAPRLFERPHHDLIDFLTELGAKIEAMDVDGRPGLRIRAAGFPSGHWQPPCRHSSQYVSGVVMAGAWTSNLQLTLDPDLPSRGYFELTLDAMGAFGDDQPLQRGENSECRSNPPAWQVPGDPSGATFFLTALVLQGGAMQLGPDWSMVHPEAQLLQWFEGSGLLIRDGERWQRAATSTQQNTIDLDPAPDAGPALAVLGAFLADGLILNGVERLRIKESDRVAGIQRLLQTLGGKADVIGDALHIHPLSEAALRQARLAPDLSYHPDGDHRLAMAAGVAQLLVPNLGIEQPQCVAKSFPDFWQQLAAMKALT